ncbi:hypothetical protein [Paraburkholderia sp.]|nr:hypothetical protein [Paraburkholderia sp.]
MSQFDEQRVDATMASDESIANIARHRDPSSPPITQASRETCL